MYVAQILYTSLLLIEDVLFIWLQDLPTSGVQSRKKTYLLVFKI